LATIGKPWFSLKPIVQAAPKPTPLPTSKTETLIDELNRVANEKEAKVTALASNFFRTISDGEPISLELFCTPVLTKWYKQNNLLSAKRKSKFAIITRIGPAVYCVG